MKFQCVGSRKIVNAYPVESCVYEIVAHGKKEFYQSPWDAFDSDLYMENISAKIIRIPVNPISDYEARMETLFSELEETRTYPSSIKDFTNSHKWKNILKYFLTTTYWALIAGTWVIILLGIFRNI